MSTTAQPPPDERVYRSLEVIQSNQTRIYSGNRLAELNRRMRALDAEKKASAAAFKAEEKKLDEERVSLEAASSPADGTRFELLCPCVGRVNLSSGQYDIYKVEKDAQGHETLTYIKSEPLPSKWAHLLQPELPFDKKGKDGKDAKDDAGTGSKGGKKGKSKDAEDDPPSFPE